MSERRLLPAGRPCASCPYRRDVPAALWHPSEYAKLERYDGSTAEQGRQGALAVFFCHSRPSRVCAGWAGTHDMAHSLALRVYRSVTGADVSAVLDYVTDVPLFASGREAALHGLRGFLVRGTAEAARVRAQLRKIQERQR